MGWWGHGVMDGDGPSGAAHMIKVHAFGGKNKRLGERKAEEFSDAEFSEEVTVVQRTALAVLVHKQLSYICAEAIKDCKRHRMYGGYADLIATAHELVVTHGVRKLPKAFKAAVKDALEVEMGDEAEDFNSPRKRRNALKKFKTQLAKVRTL